MCNLIYNPRFRSSELSGWNSEGSPEYVPDDGHAGLGCVRFDGDGDALEQPLRLPEPLTYTISVWAKGSGTATLALRNKDDAVAYTTTISGGGAGWTETETAVQLPAEQFDFRLERASGVVLVDDVSLAHVPATRAELATLAEDRLSDLATEFSLSTGRDGDLTEGDYTHAISAALRTLGMVNEWQDPDVRCMDPGDVDRVVKQIEEEMLPVLHNKALLRTESYSLGPLTERKSTNRYLAMRMGILPGMQAARRGTITVKKLRRPSD
jgi:hypothetical protein